MRIHILGQPRSGTTYIFNVIRQYYVNQQEIEFGNEPFNDHLRDSANFQNHLDSIIQTPRCVIKNHTVHLNYMKEHNLLETFLNAIDHNVLIIRRNLFDLTCSMCVSINKDQWYDYETTGKQIEIEPELFEFFYSGFYWNTAKLKNNFYNIKFDTVIEYEKLIREPKLDWLSTGLCNTDPMALISFSSQTSISPPKDKIISNHKQLKLLCNKLDNDPQFDGGLTIRNNIIMDTFND